MPEAPVIGPLRTEGGKEAMAMLRDAEARKQEWADKAAENGLSPRDGFFAEGDPARFAEAAAMLGVGNGEPAGAHGGRHRPASAVGGKLVGAAGALYDAPSKTVMDSLEGLDGIGEPVAYRVAEGRVRQARVFAASEVEVGEGKRAAIAFVPRGFAFGTWLDLVMVLGRDRGVEWWYAVPVDDAGGRRFDCPCGCEVALDLAGVAGGEDWLAGAYEIAEDPARRPRHRTRAVPAPGQAFDAGQEEIVAYGRLVGAARRIVAAAADVGSEMGPSEALAAAARLVPVLTFGREAFPVDGLPDGMDEIRVAAAESVAGCLPDPETGWETGLAEQAAQLWGRILSDGYGLVLDAESLDGRAGRAIGVAGKVGLDSAVEALYAGVPVEDIAA